MSELKPWLEEGAPLDIEHLLRAAKAEQPPSASLARTLTALGVGLGATSVAGGAAAAGTAVSAGGSAMATASLTVTVLAKWAATGAALGTLAVGAATISRDTPRAVVAPAPSLRAPVAPGPGSAFVAPRSPELVEASPDSTTSAAEPVTVPPHARPARAAASASHTSREAASVALPNRGAPLDAETLAQEVKSVDRARAALALGRALETLAVLDDYERRFPERRFAPESLYLRMEALILLGRTEQARATAERLLANYPNSPHGTRARAVLSKNP